MTTFGLIAGLLVAGSGLILHLTNYKSVDAAGRMRAKVGIAAMIVGSLTAFGPWILDRILPGS